MEYVNVNSTVRPQLPRYAMEQGIEWNQRELIFISLIWNIATVGGWDTTYYMNTQDASRILNAYGSKNTIWKKLRTIFDIGVMNEYTLSITPHEVDRMHHGMPIQYTEKPVIITEGGALQMWYYLVGRLSCGNVLSDVERIKHGKHLVWNQHQEGKLLSGRLEKQIQWPGPAGKMIR